MNMDIICHGTGLVFPEYSGGRVMENTIERRTYNVWRKWRENSLKQGEYSNMQNYLQIEYMNYAYMIGYVKFENLFN